MKAQELRVGNLVYDDDDIIEVEAYQLYILTDYFEPVPLTEEWLLKFGFENKKHGIKRGVLKSYKIHGNTFNLSNSGNIYYGFKSMQIQYVHQLQNLIFALTGEELTLSE